MLQHFAQMFSVLLGQYLMYVINRLHLLVVGTRVRSLLHHEVH